MKKYANDKSQKTRWRKVSNALLGYYPAILQFFIKVTAKCNISYQFYWALLKIQINKNCVVVLITNYCISFDIYCKRLDLPYKIRSA